MVQNINFQQNSNLNEITFLRNEWLNSLVSPPDGMWESFRSQADQVGIMMENEMIGYGSIEEQNQLIQFYLRPTYHQYNVEIFKAFIEKNNISKAIVGTNNPVFLSIALNFTNKFDVHSYLFRQNFKVNIEEKEGKFNACKKEDLKRIVDFYHASIGAPKEWLTGYIDDLITNNELYAFEHSNHIIGTCEVRKSKSAPAFADIGMVVSPAYRKKGYGTFLLHKAKNLAIEMGKTPICSCEKENPGSIKSITNCGFVSYYQLLEVGL